MNETEIGMLFWEIINVSGLVLAIISIFLLFITEWIRRPSLEFLLHKDEPTSEDQKWGRMWFHLKIRNKEPKFFNRDAAINCMMRVDFLEKNTKKPLVPQITVHWASQPEPRDYLTSQFDPSKIPVCQRLDIGFRPEMADIIIKFQGEKAFYATDPWVVYRYPKGSPEWERLKIDVDECVIRAEVEAINLGKRKFAYFTLRNKGTKLEDIEILPLDP